MERGWNLPLISLCVQGRVLGSSFGWELRLLFAVPAAALRMLSAVVCPVSAGEQRQGLGLRAAGRTRSLQLLSRFVCGLKHGLGDLPCQESLLGPCCWKRGRKSTVPSLQAKELLLVQPARASPGACASAVLSRR